uniref:N-acetylmuramoyl-L-alanine amidase n=1 Tax=Caenorhabditis tropicalis TaxID=1561998 RepID=A0A1I7TLM0_9PELO
MHSSCNASVIRQPGIGSQQTSKVERKTGEYVSIVPNYFLSNHANFGTGYSKESYDALKKYWKEVEYVYDN